MLTCLLLFSGCKEFHCPAFPDEQLKLLPQLNEHETIVYNSREGSITFSVKGYWKSKESSVPMNCDCHVCYISANLHLGNDKLKVIYSVINTTNEVVTLTKQHSTRIQIDRLLPNNEIESDLFDFVYNNETKIYEPGYYISTLERIESMEIAGNIYNDVLSLVSGKENSYAQKIYYEKSHGIVRFETVDGEVWDLVKFGNNTSN